MKGSNVKEKDKEKTTKKTQKLKREIQEKIAEKWEENRMRMYFVRLFEKYDIRNERQFILVGKWLVFVILLLAETFVLFDAVEDFLRGGDWRVFVALLCVEVVLAVGEAIKLFALKEGRLRTIFYVIDVVAVGVFMLLGKNGLSIIVYLLILTEFYIETEKTFPAVAILIWGILLYLASAWIKALFMGEGSVNLYHVIVQSFGAVFALIVHFVIINIALAFYRQFIRLDRALKELDKSKKELEKAYEAVAEVTVLEERQRIAKEIHDTAGHSLTTVIMQTELAKRIVEENPKEAKAKIVAASLQAKHALEELRNSVHLLSGIKEGQTLKDLLTQIIQESTDGTDIIIRSEIEDLQASEAKRRFLCNTLKEGISNGLRHGMATAFWFELKQEGERMEFLLSDNGKGVELASLKKGFGLTTMADRAKSLGGEMHLHSEEEEGFEIKLTLPIDK